MKYIYLIRTTNHVVWRTYSPDAMREKPGVLKRDTKLVLQVKNTTNESEHGFVEGRGSSPSPLLREEREDLGFFLLTFWYTDFFREEEETTLSPAYIKDCIRVPGFSTPTEM